MLALAMEVEAGAIADPSTVSHGSVVGLALRICVRPRKADKMMILAEVDTIKLQRSLERIDAIGLHQTNTHPPIGLYVITVSSNSL